MVHKITQLGAVLVCCLIDSAAGYLQGAPSSVCNTKDMKPQHNTEYNVNNNTAEYVLDVSATEYDPTDSSKSITVRLRHLQGDKFKGYLIQARKFDSFNYIAQGKMTGPPIYFSPICGTTGNGGTHTSDFSNNLKSEISVSWSVPEDVCEALRMGDLQFQATAVEHVTRNPFTNIYSPVLKMKLDIDPEIVERCNQPNDPNGVSDLKPATLLLLALLSVVKMLMP